MARKPLRPCLERGCPELTTGSRCETHEAAWQQHRRERVKRGELTGSRGTTWEWQVLRDKRLRIDKYECRRCGRKRADCALTGDTLQVHHVDGNSFNNVIENLVTLCSSCHRRMHR